MEMFYVSVIGLIRRGLYAWVCLTVILLSVPKTALTTLYYAALCLL